jgi:hypothetical protein
MPMNGILRGVPRTVFRPVSPSDCAFRCGPAVTAPVTRSDWRVSESCRRHRRPTRWVRFDIFRETGQSLSRDSEHVVRYLGNDMLRGRPRRGFVSAIMSFPKVALESCRL